MDLHPSIEFGETLTNSELIARTRSIWRLRNTNRTAQAYEEFLQLFHRIHLSPGSRPEPNVSQMIKEGFTPAAALDFALLEVSFIRSRFNLDLADSHLEEIRGLFHAHRVSLSWAFYFQKGLNLYARSRYAEALEWFVNTSQTGEDCTQTINALLNVILCMEYLGHDYHRFLNRLRDEFNRAAREDIDPIVYDQLQALELRAMLRNGDFSKFGEKAKTACQKEKSAFPISFYSEIPYLTLQSEFPDLCVTAKHTLTSRPEAYMAGYRLRTLQGLLIEEDLRLAVPVNSKIERFYLWVWRWLIQPDSALFSRILRLKRDLNSLSDQQLAPEDFKMYENALRWIGIFIGLDDTALRQSIAHLSYPTRPTRRIFDYESLILEYILARLARNDVIADDTYTVASSHRFHNAPYHTLDCLIRAMATNETSLPKFDRLVASLHRMFDDSKTAGDETSIVVNLGTKEIILRTDVAKPEIVRSESTSLLLHLTHHKNVVHAAEVLRYCFGVQRYDLIIHDPKIANLLSKTNRLLRGALRFSRKSGYIYLDRSDEHAVRFIGDNEHTISMLPFSETQTIMLESSAGPSVPSRAASTSKLNHATTNDSMSGWLTRRDIEKALNVSRATAVRRINHWLDQNKITKRGNGKASLYKISPEFSRELFTGSNRRDHQ